MAQMLAEQQGSGPNPVDETGLCLLSLDGGGVRGLSTLYILRNLMARLAYERYGDAVNKYPPVKPCEVFDLIGGTSTGGLIAIMLGRLEMTVDECIIAYRELIKDVFKARESRAGISAFGRVTSRFSSKALEIAIKRVLASREGVSEDDLFDDGKARGCRVFVCTVAKETRDISRLKSYTIPGESESLVRPTIWEAALATSAATRFFDPVKIGARSFIDGAMGANNPVDQVQNEAIQIWCPESADLKPLVKCFISVGTGNPGKKPIRDNAWKLLSETLVDIVTDTEKTAEMFDGRWIGDSTADRYFRFNVEQGLQDIGLEEYQKEGAIEAATFGYFKATRKSIEVKRCAKNLVRKQKKTPREFKSLFTVTSRTSTKKPHWVVHFEQNLKFVARDTQLNQLDKLLFANGHCPKVALVGLGGVGKTQIAIQLAYWIRVKYAELSVYWISATDMESLEQAYQKIGEKLEIPGLDEKQSNVKDLVRQRLSEGTTGPWLLIFDNADDPDMWSRKPHNTAKACCLQGYLPKSNTGRILFTTRSRKIACELARHNIVEVPEMDDQAAVGLLQRSLPNRTIEVDDPTVLQLLKELTYLPLAITQAAAFMNMYGASCSDYLKLLQEEKEEDVIAILSEDFEDEGRYSTTVNPVATTWLISFEQIKRHNPAAAEYMSFMSCLGAKNIPISLLPPAPSRKQMIEAVGTLSGYSFVTKRTDEALDIHRLVHLAMRNWLRTNGLLAECTTRAVTRVCEVFPSNDPKYRVMWRLYLPHAQHIL
ncbi:kinase subdomain-containing protein, partial [Aaosphaeria arxii CBS 175.79]